MDDVEKTINERRYMGRISDLKICMTRPPVMVTLSLQDFEKFQREIG